jgi:hypothetical protein
MKNILNPWVIIGAILIASILLLATFLASGSLFSPFQPEFYGEGILTVIPIPTFTATALPTAPVITPTIETQVGIQIGSYVKITGTEGDGLRMRDDPSLNGKIIYLGIEDEIFLVKDGPKDQDGYLWWYLEAPLNETKNGWAVANFLQLDQSP